VHFLLILLSHLPKACQDTVAAAMKAVFVIQKLEQVRARQCPFAWCKTFGPNALIRG
jgi:hypothetical protein